MIQKYGVRLILMAVPQHPGVILSLILLEIAIISTPGGMPPALRGSYCRKLQEELCRIG